MPVETVLHHLHIRRKKNQLVFENIARLWELHNHAQSQQDLLDGLHPWAGPMQLKFENSLSYGLAFLGLMLCLSLIISTEHPIFYLSFVVGLLLIFLAWLCYEVSKPIQEIIQALQTKAIGFKYGLQYYSMPLHLNNVRNGHSLEIKLKNMFPLFHLGSISNDFPLHASCVWEDENKQQHSVLVFQYRYITELTVSDKNGKKVRVKEIEQFLYGVFVFEIQKFRGLALSDQQRNFAFPYEVRWQSSDILFNQNLKVFGLNQHQLAKQLTHLSLIHI